MPVEWQRSGHVRFAALFGFSLGLGFATNLPSVALAVLVLFGGASSHWYSAALLAACFAVGRTAPLMSVVALNRDRAQRELHTAMERVERLVASAWWLEAVLLAGLAYSLLAPASD